MIDSYLITENTLTKIAITAIKINILILNAGAHLIADYLTLYNILFLL